MQALRIVRRHGVPDRRRVRSTPCARPGRAACRPACRNRRSGRRRRDSGRPGRRRHRRGEKRSPANHGPALMSANSSSRRSNIADSAAGFGQEGGLGRCRIEPADGVERWPSRTRSRRDAGRGHKGRPGGGDWPCVSSRNSRMTADSKITVSAPFGRTMSSGTLPSGEIALNQSGLSARSMVDALERHALFSASEIAARWT